MGARNTLWVDEAVEVDSLTWELSWHRPNAAIDAAGGAAEGTSIVRLSWQCGGPGYERGYEGEVVDRWDDLSSEDVDRLVEAAREAQERDDRASREAA